MASPGSPQRGARWFGRAGRSLKTANTLKHRELATAISKVMENHMGYPSLATLLRSQTSNFPISSVKRPRMLKHDPENACPGLDPGWIPVFGKDHTQSMS
jgi:hypothetical protein